MSTIFRYRGFRFFTYSDDHNYHVFYGDGGMVFEIKGTWVAIVRVKNMKRSDVKKALRIIRQNTHLFK